MRAEREAILAGETKKEATNGTEKATTKTEKVQEDGAEERDGATQGDEGVPGEEEVEYGTAVG